MKALRSHGRLVTVYQSALLFSLLEAEDGSATFFRKIMYKLKPNNAEEDLESARLTLQNA